MKNYFALTSCLLFALLFGCNEDKPEAECLGTTDIEVVSGTHRLTGKDPHDGGHFMTFRYGIVAKPDENGCPKSVDLMYSAKVYRNGDMSNVYKHKTAFKKGLTDQKDEFVAMLDFHDPGSFTIIFEADSGNEIPERDETNNTFEITITVTL